MTLPSTPYDELPYRSAPIEWTAPERLALASLLHGGPRPRLDRYRVLELGCGDGSNLIPMAYYRRHAEFVGIDAAATPIAIAEGKKSSLDLTNVTFIAADFRTAASALSGRFDYIVGHGVFSWVPDDARDALLALCAARLRDGGLLYLNYNAKPGWNVRGLIRDFLLAQTTDMVDLRARAERARDVAARMAAVLDGAAHPFSQLLGNEFRFVSETALSHTAHEYLAAHNRAYSRREFLELAGRHGLAYVADADFNYPTGRLPEGLASLLAGLEIVDGTADEAVDLLFYRQLHSPVLSHPAFDRRLPGTGELAALLMASPLTAEPAPAPEAMTVFRHPSGHTVEVRTETMAAALRMLEPLWPRGRRIGELFPEAGEVIDDLQLLHRNQMIELRLIEPSDFACGPDPLNQLERRLNGWATTARHTCA